MLFARREPSGVHPSCSCVVVAAGSSERMGADKLFLDLGGVPVVAATLLALARSPYIDALVVVTRREKIPSVAELCRRFEIPKIAALITGGETRTASALAGVRECGAAELVAIHDAARPLVTAEVIERAVLAAAETGAAAPAVPVRDTVRQARGGMVLRTLAREELFLMQTPQVFRADLIRDALEDAEHMHLALTDDCAAVMLKDAPVRLVEGSDENMKLTTPADLYAARAVWEARGGWM